MITDKGLAEKFLEGAYSVASVEPDRLRAVAAYIDQCAEAEGYRAAIDGVADYLRSIFPRVPNVWEVQDIKIARPPDSSGRLVSRLHLFALAALLVSREKSVRDRIP